MSIKRFKSPRIAAFTLIEMMISVAISCFVVAGVITGFMACTNSLHALSDYSSLNQNDQLAIDCMSREIRGLAGLTNFWVASYTNSLFTNYTAITNSLMFMPVNATNTNNYIMYSYDPVNLNLTRSQCGTNTTILTQCQFLNFALFQRNQSNGTFCPLPTTNPSLAKIIQVSWLCQATNGLLPAHSENVNSAEIVMRCK